MSDKYDVTRRDNISAAKFAEQEQHEAFAIDDFIGRHIDKMLLDFDNLIVEGLKQKGFEFNHKGELADFIKSRCRVTDNQRKKERIYYVDDTPFFLHNYENEFTLDCDPKNPTNITARMWSYAYL